MRTMPMNSQIELLKAHFDQGKTLTVAEALTLYGIYALSQRCGDLVRSGYPVTSEWEKHNGKRYARYSKLRITYG